MSEDLQKFGAKILNEAEKASLEPNHYSITYGSHLPEGMRGFHFEVDKTISIEQLKKIIKDSILTTEEENNE